MLKKKKRSLIGEVVFRVLRNYLRLCHNNMYYKNIHVIGKENIPAKGTPLIIASNHQNALNDALGVEFAFRDRVVSIFTRADAFNRPFIGKFLRSIYLLPAFRIDFDGVDALKNNFDIFAEAGERILEGGSVLIFPEALNQDKRWLGDFSLGYLRMAFDAAKKSDFKADIKILPLINHYSNYFKFREDMIIQCGEPVSLKDYYELYQTKPRTAQRNVNALVRQRIADMMLNITDLENYEAIDYIRETYGFKYCTDCGGNKKFLPDKLASDKALFSELDAIKKDDPETIETIYSEALTLKKNCKRFRITDENFDIGWKPWSLLIRFLCLILLFPLFVVASIPNILIFLSPYPLTKKFKAGNAHMTMFVGGIRFAVGSLVAFPIIYGLFFAVETYFWNWWCSLLHLICLPSLGLFAWTYRKFFIGLKREWRFHVRSKRSEHEKRGQGLKETINLRKTLFEKLDKILKKTSLNLFSR
ncbi:MAG: 1-acyl-sn-glycerol-3-phosphate acyltransferase [Bacteroidales bacterium]|nr:1-acyl-sn-glycerol-3-phosphate acyltransferase [Bacteroidales bacterium]